VLAHDGAVAPGEFGAGPLVFEAKQVPAEVHDHALAGHGHLAAAVVPLLKAAREAGGPRGRPVVAVATVVVPAPARAAVGIEAVDHAAQGLKVDRSVRPGRRAGDRPAGADTLDDLAPGRVEDVEAAGGGAEEDTAFRHAGRRGVASAGPHAVGRRLPHDAV